MKTPYVLGYLSTPRFPYHPWIVASDLLAIRQGDTSERNRSLMPNDRQW